MNTELIARLQSRAASMYLLEDVKLFHEAADAMEAAQAEIDRLKKRLQDCTKTQQGQVYDQSKKLNDSGRGFAVCK